MKKIEAKKTGFKVMHDLKDIDEGKEYEFTLKDRNVLDNSEEDFEVFENALLRDLNKNKKKKDNLNYEINKEILPNYNKQIETAFIIQREDIVEVKITEEQTGELNKIREKFKKMKEQKGNENSKLDQVKNLYNYFIPFFKAHTVLNIEKKFTTDYMTQEEFAKNKTFKKIKKIPLKKGIQSIDKEIVEEVNSIPEEKFMQNSRNIKLVEVYDENDEFNNYLEKQKNFINKEKKLPEEKIIKALEVVEHKNFSEVEVGNEEFISDTTEFLKKIPTKREIDENYKMITSFSPASLRDTKNGTQSVVNIPLPTERLRYGASSIIQLSREENELKMLNKKRNLNKKEENNIAEDTLTEITQIDEDTQEEPLEELEEPLVGKGIAVALKVLKNRGLIGKKILWGRYKDKIRTTNDIFLEMKKGQDKLKVNEKQRKEFLKNIEIEYRDSRGRLLTPKEMYRYQSYIFHGKGPSKRKVEKKILREQQEEKLKNMDPTLSSKTFKYLKNTQKKTNSPYVVLQGKNVSIS